MKFDAFVVGDITIDGAKQFCETHLSRAQKKSPFSILVSSDGGDIDGALVMGTAIQIMQRAGRQVHIHVAGVAHSAAVLLLQYADRRTMENYATLRIHPIFVEYENATMTISDLNGEADHMSYLHYVYYEMLQRRSGYDAEQLVQKAHYLHQDVLLYPQDCLKWSLIDEVIEYARPRTEQETPVPTSDSGNNVVPFERPQPRPSRSEEHGRATGTQGDFDPSC